MYYNYTPVPIFCQGQTVPKRTQYAGNPEKKCIKPPDNNYPLLSEYTLDPQERQKYAARLEQWQQANAKLVEEHGDVLRRRYEREVARDLRVNVPALTGVTKVQTYSQKYMSQSNTDWSMAHPQSHTKEEIDDLIQFANGFGLHLKQPYLFDGDIELYKSQIKTIADLRNEFGITDYLQIGVKDFSEEGVLGETTVNNQRIWINRKALWNREVTEMNMRGVNEEGKRFLASDKAEGIAAHEFGHILESKLKKPKPNMIDICADMIYNIDGKHLSEQEIIEWLETHFSDYSTNLKIVSLKRTHFSEILPEILSVYSTGSNAYSDYFVSAVKRGCDMRILKYSDWKKYTEYYDLDFKTMELHIHEDAPDWFKKMFEKYCEETKDGTF